MRGEQRLELQRVGRKGTGLERRRIERQVERREVDPRDACALRFEAGGGEFAQRTIIGSLAGASGDYRNLCHHSSRTRSRSEEHTSELQSLMRISSAVFCLKKKKQTN